MFLDLTRSNVETPFLCLSFFLVQCGYLTRKYELTVTLLELVYKLEKHYLDGVAKH